MGQGPFQIGVIVSLKLSLDWPFADWNFGDLVKVSDPPGYSFDLFLFDREAVQYKTEYQNLTDYHLNQEKTILRSKSHHQKWSLELFLCVRECVPLRDYTKHFYTSSKISFADQSGYDIFFLTYFNRSFDQTKFHFIKNISL